jgi:hypothetical protein
MIHNIIVKVDFDEMLRVSLIIEWREEVIIQIKTGY